MLNKDYRKFKTIGNSISELIRRSREKTNLVDFTGKHLHRVKVF